MPAQSEPSSNPWFGVSMALIGVIVGYGIAMATNASSPLGVGGGNPLVAGNPTAPTVPSVAPEAPPAADVVPVDPNREYIRGNPNAALTVIEYSDFECPFCARHHPTMISLLEEYGDDVNWVYRHFPLSFHPNAQKAAEASECVGELGGGDKFWEYADLLFAQGTDNALLADKAESIGIDRAAFETCLNSGKFASYISDQMQTGSASGVNGTPGNIVYNNETGESRIVSGAQPIESFRAAIDALK